MKRKVVLRKVWCECSLPDGWSLDESTGRWVCGRCGRVSKLVHLKMKERLL